MKRLLILLILLALPFSVAVKAQEPIAAQPSPGMIGFVAARYTEAVDTTSGILVSVGLGTRLSNSSKVWTFVYTDVGQYGSISAEIAYIFLISSKLSVGPLAGPGMAWSDGEQPIAYLTGAAGLIASYDIKSTFGLAGYGKYLFVGEIQKGWTAGGVLYKRF